MKYLEENPEFVYSEAEDGIFCLPCVVFATKDNLGQFGSMCGLKNQLNLLHIIPSSLIALLCQE